MTVTAPETRLRGRVQAALDAEFTAESLTFQSDKLNASLGSDGQAYAAVYPGPARRRVGNDLVLEITVYVQIFLPFTPEVNPQQEVDPGVIEEYAERLRRALQADDDPGNGEDDAHTWFYEVIGIEYPDDPTGNKSRLVAEVLGMAQNPGVTLTTG